MERNKIKYLLMSLALNNNFSMPGKDTPPRDKSHHGSGAAVPSSTIVEMNIQETMDKQQKQLLLFYKYAENNLKNIQKYIYDLINLKNSMTLDEFISIKTNYETFTIRKDTEYTLKIKITKILNREKEINKKAEERLLSINQTNNGISEQKEQELDKIINEIIKEEIDNLKKDQINNGIIAKELDTSIKDGITYFIYHLECIKRVIRSTGLMDDNNHSIFLTNDIPDQEICLTLVGDSSVYIFQMQSKNDIKKDHLIVFKPGTGLITDNKTYANIKEILIFISIVLAFSTIAKNFFDMISKK